MKKVNLLVEKSKKQVSIDNLNKLEKKLKKVSQTILNYPNNWDGEGAETFKEETWERSVKLLKNILYNIWEALKNFSLPSILPVPDSSIDIHWDTNIFELLINIPSKSKELIHYSGEPNGHPENEIEGRCIDELVELVLTNWLKKIH